MLIDGPADWCEAWFATGVKTDILQNGYNPKLQVSAMSLGPKVIITRYNDGISGFCQHIGSQQPDSLVLPSGDSSSMRQTTPHYRLVAWSQVSGNMLAIASSTQVEIWEVTVASAIAATLRSTVNINDLQRISWNPRSNALLACSNIEIILINASNPLISWRTIYANNSPRQSWGVTSWSPCGLQVSLAQYHALHCFCWTDVDSLLSKCPEHDQVDVRTLSNSISQIQLEADNDGIGPIAAVARVSPTVCIVTTSVKLVLKDEAPCIFKIQCSNEKRSTSTELLHTAREIQRFISAPQQEITSSSDIIDLTSMRAMTKLTQESLQLLNHDTAQPYNTGREKIHSRLFVAEYKNGKWIANLIFDLPYLTSPDIMAVQDMRVIVGSTLSPRLVVVHLDASNHGKWGVTQSSELELPPGHVCRGIYIAKKFPLFHVASTEKRKRTSFFHADAILNPQLVYLSKFEVPQREQLTSSANQIINVQKVLSNAVNETSSGFDNDKCNQKHLLELILEKLAVVQMQMNRRFDDVDKTLLEVAARVKQLERKSGISSE